MASDLVMPHYGKTHMGIPIGFCYGHATVDCMSTPGLRIRSLRRAKDLNQKDLAAKVGIDQSTLSDIENGAGFSAEKLMLFAAELETTAEQIMTGNDPRAWPFPTIAYERFIALDIRQRAIAEGKLDAAIESLEAQPETKTANSLRKNVKFDSDKATQHPHDVGADLAPGKGRPVLVPPAPATSDNDIDRMAAEQREAGNGKRSGNRKTPERGNARRR